MVNVTGLIVDTHMHVWKVDPPRYTLEQTLADVPLPTTDALIEEVVTDNAAAGITHTVLVQPSTSGWDNRYVVERAAAQPHLFAAHGLIDPDSRTNAADLRAGMAAGMAGLRLNMVRDRDPAWVSAARNHALWETAQELGAVINVQMHPPQAWRLREMAHRYPGVKVIVDHLGKPDITEPPPYAQFANILALANLPNTYVKVSALSLASRTKEYPYRDVFPWVKMLYEAFGASRLLWGTGYPGAHRALPLDKELAIITQHLPFLLEDDKHWILGRTAMTIWSFAAG